jgi:hypothetical protein
LQRTVDVPGVEPGYMLISQSQNYVSPLDKQLNR